MRDEGSISVASESPWSQKAFSAAFASASNSSLPTLGALRKLRRQVLDLCSQRSNIRSLTITVGRQSGVAPTLVCASEMASSTSCTMRPSSLPQCTDFQQFALPRDNKRLSLKRACSASSFATGCAGCLQTPPASCVRAGDGFLATDARNSPEACCVGLSCVLTRCACLTVASCPRAWARDPAHQTPAPQPPPPHPRKPHPRGSRTSHGVATHTHPTPQ